MYRGYKTCIENCYRCVAACMACASACLQESNVNELTKCIQLDLECAAICKAAGELMALDSQHANAITQLCGDMCNACAEECEKHEMEHCRLCAIECRKCAEECLSMSAA